jgi:hypothetical protein
LKLSREEGIKDTVISLLWFTRFIIIVTDQRGDSPDNIIIVKLVSLVVGSIVLGCKKEGDGVAVSKLYNNTEKRNRKEFDNLLIQLQAGFFNPVKWTRTLGTTIH